MVDGGMRKCSAGACPRWGRGGAWQNPTRQFAVPNHNSGFSNLGVPAPAGMTDWYENRPPLSSFPRKRESRGGAAGAPRATLSRYGQFSHNLRFLLNHNLQTRRTNYAQI